MEFVTFAASMVARASSREWAAKSIEWTLQCGQYAGASHCFLVVAGVRGGGDDGVRGDASSDFPGGG